MDMQQMMPPGMGMGPPGMGMPPQGGQIGDPMELLAALKLAQSAKGAPQPIYLPGYKAPPKPDPKKIEATGKDLWENGRLWRALIYNMLRWTRQELTGMFEEDREERANGFQEEFISPILSAERNLVIAKLASLDPHFTAQSVQTDELKGYAQQLENFARWLRDMESLSHPGMGNRPLKIDEAALFVDYGMYVTRDTFNKDNADCPVNMTLIDPAQVYPIWGQPYSGLRAVYRVFDDSVAWITQAYGDLPPSVLKKLKDKYGEVDDETELSVVEYWDTWWRCVLINGEAVIGPTAHEYGEVPWTIQYGGYGEPMFTRTPEMAELSKVGSSWTYTSNKRSNERINKATPYLFYQIKNHEIYEAVMGRLITGFKKEINPPTIRYRSDMAAEKEMPNLDAAPGAQNEAMLGEEKIEALPTATSSPLTQTILQSVIADKRMISMPQESYGAIDKSNVSGTAMANASDAGMDKIAPATMAWGSALGNRYGRIARMVANFGYMAEYGGAEPRKLMIPVTKPRKGQPSSYHFSRDVIEKVGSRISVSFSKVDPRDWVGLFSAAQPGITQGLVTRADIRKIATGDGDYDRFLEEWMEENAIFSALQLPEYAKAVTVPQAFLQQIAENEGNPEMQQIYQTLLEGWMQVTAPQPQMQPGMQQPQPGMQGDPNAAAQMGPSPAPPGSVVIPPTSAGVSLPAMGMGPGSQGGAVGRPPGM